VPLKNEPTGYGQCVFHWKRRPATVVNRQRLQTQSGAAEVFIHRLRLGRCRLNAILHQMRRHDTGDCDFCGELEIVQHFLMDCPENEVATTVKTVKSICQQRGIDFNLFTILRRSALLSEVHRLSDRRLWSTASSRHRHRTYRGPLQQDYSRPITTKPTPTVPITIRRL